MALNYATSFDPVNYSGELFNKGNVSAPFSSAIGLNGAYNTNHVEFAVGQSYSTEGGEQPNISEIASLVAPDFTPIGREQMSNVTQIFHYSVGVSYAKESNMGTLAGINHVGQTVRPPSELAFQTNAQIIRCRRDIEYTFINGVYNKATSDATVNRTRGMNAAITSNVYQIGGGTTAAPLTIWDVVAAQELVYNANAPYNQLVLWCDATTMLQLNANAIENGLSPSPASRNVNGINITTLITPFAEIGIVVGQFIPAGTAFLFNLDVIHPVYQPVPGKGNFFLEMLAKVGAGERYQLFGQIGLDHGPEWYHAKITNISTDFTPPANP